MKAKDIAGQKFGRLTAIRRVENFPRYKQAVWLCKCDCGNDHRLFGYLLWHEKVFSCGCWKREMPVAYKTVHGMTGTTEFRSWVSMRGRCTNIRNPAYKDYGGRGITICEKWDTFSAFYADMGPKPAGASLDRINNDLGYSPENCRWATKKQQVGNRRTTTYYSFDGAKLSLQDWATKYSLPYQTIWSRFKRGWRGHQLLGPLGVTSKNHV